MKSRLLIALLVASTALPAAPAGAQAGCQFELGFQSLRDLIPDQVGDCTDNEAHNPANGDGLQHTSAWHGQGGLLVWRKADNWTAFTDGATTWINGPGGVVSRPNSGPLFAWEAGGSAPAGRGPAGPAALGGRWPTPAPAEAPLAGPAALGGRWPTPAPAQAPLPWPPPAARGAAPAAAPAVAPRPWPTPAPALPPPAWPPPAARGAAPTPTPRAATPTPAPGASGSGVRPA